MAARTNRWGGAAPARPAKDLLRFTADGRARALHQRPIPICRRGEAKLRALLSRFDRRRVRFEVWDVSQQPDRAEAEGVCYTPMLVKQNRHPVRVYWATFRRDRPP